jgi:hypothetical protein
LPHGLGQTSDSNGDGTSDYVASVTQSFDSHGNLVKRVESTDSNGDGTAESVTTTTYVKGRA